MASMKKVFLNRWMLQQKGKLSPYMKRLGKEDQKEVEID